MATAQLSHQAVTTRAARRSSRTRGQTMWGYLLIAPMMTGFAIFFLFALAVSLGLSRTLNS
jgi:ABC-type sugar transport system permease subunit